MSLQLSTIRSTLLDFLREEDSSSSSYSTAFLNNRINTAQYHICAGMVIWPDNRAVKKLKLPFLFKQVFYKNIGSVGLTANAVVWATTLDVWDTTNYPSTWHLWIANNIITYTWKSATQFTWCTGIDYEHQEGTRVYPIYSLPADYMNTLNVSYNNSFPIEFVDEQEVYQITNQYKWGGWYAVQGGYIQWTMQVSMTRKLFYSVLRGLYFAPYYLDNSTGMFCLSYEMLPTEMTLDSSTCIIPNDTLALDAIANLAVADVLFDRWEEERGLRRQQRGIQRTRLLYNFFNRASAEDQFGKSVRMEKWTGRNF